MATHYLETEIEIEASAERVWAVLSDFSSYPQWNPFIKSIVGVPEQGSQLHVAIQPTGGKVMRFAPVVLTAVPARELRWLGRFILPGIFDGEHRLAIEPIAKGKVRFQQSEKFSGLLVSLLRNGLNSGTKSGFEAMNRALKARAEENPNVESQAKQT